MFPVSFFPALKTKNAAQGPRLVFRGDYRLAYASQAVADHPMRDKRGRVTSPK
jgi:hypothetical protein